MIRTPSSFYFIFKNHYNLRMCNIDPFKPIIKLKKVVDSLNTLKYHIIAL